MQQTEAPYLLDVPLLQFIMIQRVHALQKLTIIISHDLIQAGHLVLVFFIHEVCSILYQERKGIEISQK
jgi:hypothetical protein